MITDHYNKLMEVKKVDEIKSKLQAIEKKINMAGKRNNQFFTLLKVKNGYDLMYYAITKNYYD